MHSNKALKFECPSPLGHKAINWDVVVNPDDGNVPPRFAWFVAKCQELESENATLIGELEEAKESNQSLREELTDTRKLVGELCAKIREEGKPKSVVPKVAPKKRKEQKFLADELKIAKAQGSKALERNKKMRSSLVTLTEKLRESDQKCEEMRASFEAQLNVAQQQMGREQRSLLEKMKEVEAAKAEVDEKHLQSVSELEKMTKTYDSARIELDDLTSKFESYKLNASKENHSLLEKLENCDDNIIDLQTEIDSLNQSLISKNIELENANSTNNIEKKTVETVDETVARLLEEVEAEKTNRKKCQELTAKFKQRREETARLNRIMYGEMQNLRLKLYKVAKREATTSDLIKQLEESNRIAIKYHLLLVNDLGMEESSNPDSKDFQGSNEKSSSEVSMKVPTVTVTSKKKVQFEIPAISASTTAQDTTKSSISTSSKSNNSGGVKSRSIRCLPVPSPYPGKIRSKRNKAIKENASTPSSTTVIKTKTRISSRKETSTTKTKKKSSFVKRKLLRKSSNSSAKKKSSTKKALSHSSVPPNIKSLSATTSK